MNDTQQQNQQPDEERARLEVRRAKLLGQVAVVDQMIRFLEPDEERRALDAVRNRSW